MSRRSSKLSMTGRSHHSCVRCPKTAPMRATCLSSDLAVAGGGLEDPAEDLDGGRLPRPVRTNETEQLAFAEREADALEGFDDPVASSEETLNGSERPAGSLCDAERFR